MTASLIRGQGAILAASLLALLLVGCVGSTTGYLSAASAPPPVPASAPPPPNRHPDELIGRWGYAAYHRDADRARTQAAARGGCNRPYTITRGSNSGVLMHLADEPELQELRLNWAATEGHISAPTDRHLIREIARWSVLTDKCW